jgi:hypothetical protein
MEKKTSDRSLKCLAILSALLFFGVLAVNVAANALPLNGVTTGQLSDEIPNLFVPAGLTFSIWGLIYLLLALYVVFIIAESFGRRSGAAWSVGDAVLFCVNEAANIGWIFAWQWRLVPLSLGIMLVILGTLIALEVRATKRLRSGGELARGKWLPRFALSVPIRVYLGWILVATIANATACLVKAGWDGFGLDPRFWTVLVIVVGCALALGFAFTRRAIATPAVVIWAYLGIIIKRLSVDRDYSASVWITALAAAIVISLAIVFISLRPKRGAKVTEYRQGVSRR